MKNPRLPLLKRLALFAPMESIMCVLLAILGVWGIWGVVTWERDALASKITPAIYAFGMAPYIGALCVAIALGLWALEKSSD